MKKKKSLRLMFIFEALIQVISLGQGNAVSDYTHKNVTVATLIVDWDTNKFDGGNMSFYTCPDCTGDSVPFLMDYHGPGDVGRITFTLPNIDTVFDGSIVWLGTGKRYYPVDFGFGHPFKYVNHAVKMPVKYLTDGFYYYPVDSFKHHADIAWKLVDSLEITNIIASNNGKAAIYRYTPAVGDVDLTKVKMIVFLYCTDSINYTGNDEVSVLDRSGSVREVSVFPNPVADMLYINSRELFQYKIVDLTGKLFLQGTIINDRINLTGLSEGIYILSLTNNKDIITQKIVKIKGP